MAGSLQPLEKDIMKTMLYFDIFRYPLKADEVFHFLQRNSVAPETVAKSLDELADRKVLFRYDQLFSLSNSGQDAVRRLRGNQLADDIMPFATKQASLIASFPFVRAVMGSGSFSKNYMDEKSDLDFFIVTSANSVWLVKTMLAVYKRVFLGNSHKYFCTNYFLDEHHLEIDEKNLFTATELATLVPLYNGAMYRKLIEANQWLREFFPNFTPRNFDQRTTRRRARKTFELMLWPFKGIMEIVLKWLNVSRLKFIYEKSYSPDDFRVAFKATKHASKIHPRNFQRVIMNRYHEKLNDHQLHQS
jgi:hypothetical protein